MKYGTEKTTLALDGKGSTVAVIKKFRNGDAEKVLKHYRIRIKVANAQDEMSEFIRFIEEVGGYHRKGSLTSDREDPSTKPMFIIDYPKDNIDGSYFVIKCYSIIDL